MPKMKTIRPIDSKQRIPLRMDGCMHGRGESDNALKFSIKNCDGQKCSTFDLSWPLSEV